MLAVELQNVCKMFQKILLFAKKNSKNILFRYFNIPLEANQVVWAIYGGILLQITPTDA